MKKISIELDGTTLSFLIFPGPIGVSVSGGADSAILLYILMKYSIEPIHVFTAALKTKNNVAPRLAIRIIEKCIELTGNTNVYHHVHFIDDMSKDGNLFNGHRFFLKNNLLSKVYTGETLMPPKIEFKKWKILFSIQTH